MASSSSVEKDDEERQSRLNERMRMMRWLMRRKRRMSLDSADFRFDNMCLSEYLHTMHLIDDLEDEEEEPSSLNEMRRMMRRRRMIEMDFDLASFRSSAEPAVKLSSSLEFLPPNMSEISVVLLGDSRTEREAVISFIMSASKTCEEVKLGSFVGSFVGSYVGSFVSARGRIKDKVMVLINTPDLDPNMSDHRLTEFIENCVRLCDPGPHVFLLVLQPEGFTEDHKERLCRVLTRFSDKSFNHSLILISTPSEEKPDFMREVRQQPVLKDLIKVCKYRYLWRKDLELPELLTRLGQIMKENGGEGLGETLRKALDCQTPPGDLCLQQ